MKELQNYAAILVAAGLSSRFGQDDKLLTEICGAPLLSWSLKPLLSAGLGWIVIVTGENDEQVRSLCQDLQVTFVNNPNPSSGIGASIAIGAGAIREKIKDVFICLGDMPLIPPFIFQDLANMLAAVEGTDAAAPVHNGKRGHPVLFHRRHLAALQSLSGDEGARSILKTPGFHMAEQRVQDAGVLIDLDRLEHRSDIEQRVKQVFGI